MSAFLSTILSGGSILRALEHEYIEKRCRGMEGKILDLGSGKTPYYKLFSPKAKTFRSDIDPESGADFIFDANEKFPMNDSEFDIVFSMNLLEHLREPERAINEAYRVLKKGGKLYLTVPFMYPYHGDYGDYYRFTHKRIETFLTKAGFSSHKIDRLAGRIGVVTEFMAQSVPAPLGRFVRLPYLLGRFFDERILTKTEKKFGGRLFYLGMFIEAIK